MQTNSYKNYYLKLFTFVFGATLVAGNLAAVRAQTREETEAAQSSQLTGVALASNAQRILPASVPAEINDTLDKIVAGDARLERGETEVIVWAGADYRKSNAAQIVNKLRTAWKADGWQFEIGGEENGMALFSLLKDGEQRRAVIGFYGATDDALVFALTELHRAGNSNVKAETETEKTESPKPQIEKPATKSNASPRDSVGKWEKKSVVN